MADQTGQTKGPPAKTFNGQNLANSAAPTRNDGPRPVPNSDRRATTTNAPKSGIVQPKPQDLPKRSGPASIIVSPRQKGNPVLTNIKSMPWEYGDIPADYVLGLTTCALFLSLKYHRLHPEYIFNRLKGIQHKYHLRLVLVLVDIPNHEDSLRELSKTSAWSDITLILCWKSEECARYLELFKTYEHAPPTAIRQHQSDKYADRMVEFVTTPRSVNKTDAVSLVSQFGSLRTAVNARHEDVAGIAGWGDKKVKAWTGAVREGFRTERGKKRRVGEKGAPLVALREETTGMESAEGGQLDRGDEDGVDQGGAVGDGLDRGIGIENNEGSRDSEEALAAMETRIAAKDAGEKAPEVSKKRKQNDDPLSDGVMAALSKLRKDG